MAEGDGAAPKSVRRSTNIVAITITPPSPSVGVDHELVHAARAQRRADGIHHHLAGVDVADELAAALARVRALAQQDDARLLREGEEKGRGIVLKLKK